jgi:hypothetical protein
MSVNGTCVEEKMRRLRGVNVHILASKSVPFTLTTVQVSNLARTQHESDYSAYTLTQAWLHSHRYLRRTVVMFHLATLLCLCCLFIDFFRCIMQRQDTAGYSGLACP